RMRRTPSTAWPADRRPPRPRERARSRGVARSKTRVALEERSPGLAAVRCPWEAGPLGRGWGVGRPVVVGGPPWPCPPGPVLAGGPGVAGGPLLGGETVAGGAETLGGDA